MFGQELGKHDRLTSLIEQNLSAQSKILAALTEANARYGDTRRWTNDIQSRRAATVAALLSSAHAYPELLSKGNKGLEFYRKLEASVNKLLQRLRSVCLVQQEERSAQSRSIQLAVHSNVAAESDAPEGPKLKDFLHLMKKDSLPVAPLPAASLPAASLPAASLPAAPLPVDTAYSYPYHRPAPLGAEHSEKQDHYQTSSGDAGFPPGSYSATAGSAGYASGSRQASLSTASGGNGEFSYNFPSNNSQVAPFTSGAYSSAQYGYAGYPAKQSSSQEPADKMGAAGPSAGSQYPYQYGYTTSGNPTAENPPADKSIQSAPQYPYQYAYPASANANSGLAPMNKPVQSGSQYPYHYGYPASSNPSMDKPAQTAPQYSYQYGYGMSANPASGSPAPVDASSRDPNSGNPPMDQPVQSVPQYTYQYGYSTPGNPASGNPIPGNPQMDSSAQSVPQYSFQYGYATTGVPTAANPPIENPVQSAPQYLYQYGYPASGAPASGAPASGSLALDKTVHSGFQPTYQYGYPSVLNPEVHGSPNYSGRAEGFPHVTTGTTNTAPISGRGSNAAGIGSSYHTNAQATNSYYSYPYGPPPTNAPDVPATPLAPVVPAVPVPSPPSTNLELLSLLDQSVPAPNTVLLVPSNTNGTVTLTTSRSITPMELNSGPSTPISSVFESPAPVPVPPAPVPVPPAPVAVDPLADPEAVAKLAQEVDKFDKLVDGNYLLKDF